MIRTHKAAGAAKYIEFFVDVIIQACIDKDFPQNEATAEHWNELAQTLGAKAAFGMPLEAYAVEGCELEDSPLYRRFYHKVQGRSGTMAAMRGQQSQICTAINNEFFNGEGEYAIIANPSFGFYCTKNPNDVNLDRMKASRLNAAHGYHRAAEVLQLERKRDAS